MISLNRLKLQAKAIRQLDQLVLRQLGGKSEQEIAWRRLSRAGMYMVAILYRYTGPGEGWLRVRSDDGCVVGAIPIAHWHNFARMMVRIPRSGQILLEYSTETPAHPPRVFAVGAQRLADISAPSALALSPTSVCAALASRPSRRAMLKATIDSLLPQVDHLFVYLSGCRDVPQYLLDTDETRVHFVVDALPANSATSRFHWIGRHNCYWLICDDEIIYPSDYRERMLAALAAYSDQAIVGVQGTISVPGNGSGMREVAFQDGLAQDTGVHALASGGICFHASLFSRDDVTRLLEPSTRTDEVVVQMCRLRGIEQISVARESDWLRSHPWEKFGVQKEAIGGGCDRRLSLDSPWPAFERGPA